MEHEKSGPLVEGKACHWCGKPGHFASRCSFRDTICHNCGKRGHLARACMSGKQKPFKEPCKQANVVDADTTGEMTPPDDLQYHVPGFRQSSIPLQSGSADRGETCGNGGGHRCSCLHNVKGELASPVPQGPPCQSISLPLHLYCPAHLG